MYLSSRHGVKRAGIVGAGGPRHCRRGSQKTASKLTMRVRSPTRPSRSRLGRLAGFVRVTASPEPKPTADVNSDPITQTHQVAPITALR
jgi:hypothetical protein